MYRRMGWWMDESTGRQTGGQVDEWMRGQAEGEKYASQA